MKIAFFTETYYPQLNGVPISIDNFKHELEKRGHTVYIVAPRMKPYQDHDSHILRLPSVKILSSEPEVFFPFPVTRSSLKGMFKEDFDIIHAHGNGAFSLLGRQVARVKGVPFVMTFHNLHTKYTHYVLNGKVLKPRMVAAAMRMFGNVCDGVITPSEKMKRELLKYGVKKDIMVIPNFVYSSRFENIQSGYLHKTYNIPQSSQILLTVGRLGKEKNFPFIIKSFKRLTKKDKTTHLVIVGHGVEKENLLQLTNRLGLEKRIHFTDKIDKESMPEVYADADIFVFASTTEVHPMVVLEAAAAGLPFIVVKDAAYMHIIEEGINGYVTPMNQDNFTQKVSVLLQNKHLQKTFGNSSRKLLQQYFNPDTITDELVSLYIATQQAYKPQAHRFRNFNKTAMHKLRQTTEVIDRFFNSQ